MPGDFVVQGLFHAGFRVEEKNFRWIQKNFLPKRTVVSIVRCNEQTFKFLTKKGPYCT